MDGSIDRSDAIGERVWNIIDLFCGAAGGWSLGLHRVGYRTIAACEVDPWRRAVYAANNPGVVTFHDIRELTADRILAACGCLPDIVVGSPPCQDASSANHKGRGVDAPRTGLFFEFIRLVGEVRPLWCAAENVPGLRVRGYDRVAAGLEALGYAVWPLVVGADDAGANHRRKRVWIVAVDASRLGCDCRGSPQATGWTEPFAAGDAEGHAADPDGAGHSVGPSLAGHDGEELPPALRDIGRAWPDWNGGLAGLAASCAAAGFSRVDARLPTRLDSESCALPPSIRNAAIAAYGDAVVPAITEAIGRAMWKMFA